MIKLNDTQASSINVLAEGELDKVVGGCGGYGRRHGRGHRWGHGYGKRDHDKGYEPSYEEPSYDEPSYDEPSYAAPVVNNTADVDVTITINQGAA